MRTAWLPAAGLLVLAPVCAEYLWGYDDSTGHWGTLLGNLVVFAPLYGAPALLVRETARRLGLGWPGILLLAAVFGVVEAGLVDQSMWSTDYRDIPYWHQMAAPTYVAPIGLSLYLAVLFVGGHVVLSIGAPIALVETLTPVRRRARWLGPVSVVVVALLYLAASALVLGDAVSTGEATATPAQLVATGAAALGLVVAAVRTGGRPATIVPGRVPPARLVAAGALAGTALLIGLPPSRLGTAAVVGLTALGTYVVWRLSHRGDWGQPHVLALAAGALVASGSWAFLTTPIGDVTDTEKYAHNVVLLLLVLGLSAWAARRARAGWPRGWT